MCSADVVELENSRGDCQAYGIVHIRILNKICRFKSLLLKFLPFSLNSALFQNYNCFKTPSKRCLQFWPNLWPLWQSCKVSAVAILDTSQTYSLFVRLPPLLDVSFQLCNSAFCEIQAAVFRRTIAKQFSLHVHIWSENLSHSIMS